MTVAPYVAPSATLTVDSGANVDARFSVDAGSILSVGRTKVEGGVDSGTVDIGTNVDGGLEAGIVDLGGTLDSRGNVDLTNSVETGVSPLSTSTVDAGTTVIAGAFVDSGGNVEAGNNVAGGILDSGTTVEAGGTVETKG
jgi:hypothetical protein